MDILAQRLDAEAAYKLLTGVVVPRPIAWISTISPNGGINLAPFSAFTFVSNKPPMIGISIGRKGGVLKDTARNIRERREFVVNVADFSLLEALHLSAEEHPPEISEAEVLGLETAASRLIATPRIAAAPIALECRLHQIIEFGELKTAFMVGEVLNFHFREGLCVDGKVQTADLHPIARLGGPNYATLAEAVTLRAVHATRKGAAPVEDQEGTAP